MTLILPQHKNIAAIVPNYCLSGDNTTLITLDGQPLLLKKRVQTVVTSLARTYCIDMKALKLHTSHLLGKSQFHPLPLSDGLTLIPIKTRPPRIRGDNCTGYVNLNAIDKITAKNDGLYRSEIHFQGNNTLSCCWKAETVEKSLRDARLVTGQLPLSPLAACTKLEGQPSRCTLSDIEQQLVEILRTVMQLRLHRD